MKIDRIVLDSTGATTELCRLGARFGTDKSPYSGTWHHHAYTAAYDLLFASKRYSAITLGELGILDNSSMRMWRSYFSRAALVGFEVSEEKIAAARAERLPNTHYLHADVSSRASMFDAFNEARTQFDILIDDSTHLSEHQINFVEAATPFVKPGGLLIVEDVFRGWDESRYAAALAPLALYFSSMLFLETNHAGAFSEGTVEPYFDNDKLLLLYRNDQGWQLPDSAT